MSRTTTILLTTLLVLSLTSPASAQFVPAPFTGTDGAATRIDGDTPAAFAVALSQAAHPDFPVDTAVVVSDVSFADALAASGLTSFGAVFFASPGAPLDDASLAEIDRVISQQGELFVIGGTAVVDPAVEAQLQGLGGDRTVRRLSGPTRFETAVAVADAVVARRFDDLVPDVYVARAFGPDADPTAAWADSVTAGAAASLNGVPILFTATDSLHPTVQAWVDANSPTRATVLGGTAAIAASTSAAIAAPTRRVAGSSRDDTAATLFRQVLRDGGGIPRTLALVDLFDPLGWAYGLAVAPVVGGTIGGILAVNGDTPLATTRSVAACSRPAEALVAGPEAMISDAAAEAALTCPDGADTGSTADDPLALRGDGVGADIDFGDPLGQTMTRAEALLGPPTDDTGRVQPFCELAGPDDPAGRVVTYGDELSLVFRELAGLMFLDSWSYRLDGPGAGLATPEGITIGSTNAQIQAVHGADALRISGDPGSFPPPITAIDTPRGPIDALTTANGADGVVTDLFGGGLSFCE